METIQNMIVIMFGVLGRCLPVYRAVLIGVRVSEVESRSCNYIISVGITGRKSDSRGSQLKRFFLLVLNP